MLMRCAASPGVILLASVPTAASADCNSPGLGKWRFGETIKLVWHSTDGGICSTDLRPYSSTQMLNLQIVARPRHGTAGRSGLTSIAYRPAPGFKGTDSFTVSLSGIGHITQGTTTVQVAVTVD